MLPCPLLCVAVRPGRLPAQAWAADTPSGTSRHGRPGRLAQAGPLGLLCGHCSPGVPVTWQCHLMAVFPLSSRLSGNWVHVRVLPAEACGPGGSRLLCARPRQPCRPQNCGQSGLKCRGVPCCLPAPQRPPLVASRHLLVPAPAAISGLLVGQVPWGSDYEGSPWHPGTFMWRSLCCHGSN